MEGSKVIALLLSCIVCHVSCTYNLVGFWGTVRNEPDLYKVCESSPYSKIVVGFIDFKKGKPTMFKNHCKGNSPDDVKCHKIAFGIEKCHELNKQVLVGIGGPDSRASFRSKNDALRMARRTWKAFFVGNGPTKQRPFLGQNFDGINFYMNGNKNKFFDVFLQEFDRLRCKSNLVSVIITVSPSCFYDSGYFSRALADSTLSSRIDEIYVRFTDKACFISPNQWQRNLKNWFRMSGSSVYYAVPSPLPEFQRQYAESLKSDPQLNNPDFRGFAILDSSLDQRYRTSTKLAANNNDFPFTTPFTPSSTPALSTAQPGPVPPQPDSTQAPPPVVPPKPVATDPPPPLPTVETTTTTPAPVTSAPSGGAGGGGLAPGPVGPSGGDSGAGGVPALPPVAGGGAGGIGNSIAQPFETSDVLSNAIDKKDQEDDEKDQEEIEEEMNEEKQEGKNDEPTLNNAEDEQQAEPQPDQQEEQDVEQEEEKDTQAAESENNNDDGEEEDEDDADAAVESNGDEKPGIIEGGYVTEDKQPKPQPKAKQQQQSAGGAVAATKQKQKSSATSFNINNQQRPPTGK